MTKKSDKYEGKAFSREQVICVAEAILGGAMDLLQGGLPDSMTWDERVSIPHLHTDEGPHSLSIYERGVLEGAGESLAVFYAQRDRQRHGVLRTPIAPKGQCGFRKAEMLGTVVAVSVHKSDATN